MRKFKKIKIHILYNLQKKTNKQTVKFAYEQLNDF